VAVAAGVGVIVWVGGGGGGGSCRAAAAAVHRHATSAPALTSRMLNSILDPLGGNCNELFIGVSTRSIHHEGTKAGGVAPPHRQEQSTT
jgi:hypothetical protein